MTIKEIIEKYLKDNGYNGLYNEDIDCACDLNDLMPCNEYYSSNCRAGYYIECDEEHKADGVDFCIGEENSV